METIEFTNVALAQSYGRELQDVANKLLGLNEKLTSLVEKMYNAWASTTVDRETYLDSLRKVIKGLGYGDDGGLIASLKTAGRICEMYSVSIQEEGGGSR